MSIKYDEYVGGSALTWEDVYQAFKARLVGELVARDEYNPEAGPDYMLAERYVVDLHEDNGIGFCAVCGQDLTTAHAHKCPGPEFCPTCGAPLALCDHEAGCPEDT
jgi:hypothetical protein